MPQFAAKLRLESLDGRIVPSIQTTDAIFASVLASYSVTYSTSTISASTESISATSEEQLSSKPKAFEKIDEVTDIFKKNKVAADLLADFEKAGGTIEIGSVSTGAKLVTGAKPRIVLDPTNLEDKSMAVGGLLFELIRWKNLKQQQDIVAKVRAGTLTPEEGALASEKLTYDYMTEQQKILKDAIKAGDWTITTNRVGDLLDKYKTFDDFLAYLKTSGHYKGIEDQLKALAPKKE